MKKLLFYCLSFILVLGMVGCEKENDTIDIREPLIEEIVQAPMSYFFVDKDYEDIFATLSTEELDLYFQKMATKITKVKLQEYKDHFRQYDLGQSDLEEMHYALMKEWNTTANEMYDANINQLSFKEADEAFETFNHVNIIDDLSPEIQKKVCQHFMFLEQDGQSTTNQDEKSASNCNAYSYYIPSGTASSGLIPCLSYDNATYTGSSDCDYEFIFNWPYNYTPALVHLYSSSWGGRRVLGLGGINGRINFSSSGNSIRFLIGKGRVNFFTNGPSSFRSTLRKT